MEIPKYDLVASKSLTVFEFTSMGTNGPIPKLIKFSETTLKGFYNIAFGDINLKTGEIDDKSVSNNGDTEQILATIVSAVYIFTNANTQAWVFATGSTKFRTRLYRMGITKYIIEVKKDFEVYGLIDGEWEEFKKSVDYSAFVVRRK